MMKTFWTVVKVTAVAAVALIAVFVLVVAVWGTRSAARFRKRIEAVRSAGDPVSLAELARPPIPPEANAAVVLSRAEADLEAIQTKLLGVYGSEGYYACRPTDAELEAIRSALEAHPNVIPVLRRAADCPDYDSQPDYAAGTQAFLVDNLGAQKLRSAARLLKARALLLQSEGKLDEALEQCILLLRLAQHLDREPMIVSYLVAVACRGIAIDTANRVLRTGPVSQGMRDALDAELAAHDSMEAFQWALKSERAFGLESYQALPARRAWPIRARWDDDAAAYLDMIDEQLTLTSQPYCDVAEATEAKPPVAGATLAEHVKPAILAGRQAADRNLAMIRCLRVLNALQALEQKGGVPEPKLSGLGLPAEATIDPFTGEPLKVKKHPEGWLVYSDGQDLADDGGKLNDPSVDDVGVGPLLPTEGEK